MKNLIINEYSIRTNVLFNIGKHIDNMNRESILHHTNRNKLTIGLSSCTVLLNECYNNIMNYYKDFVIDDIFEKKMIDSGNFDVIQKIGNSKIMTLITPYFAKVDIGIYDLMRTIGSTNMSELLKFSLGSHYREKMNISKDVIQLNKFIQDKKKNLNMNNLMRYIHNSSALIDLLDKTFVPVEMYVSKKTFQNKKTTVLINHYDFQEIITSEESNRFKYEIMLENCYKITVKCANTKKTFVFIGYFNYDATNTIINTSQISEYNYVYQKKRILAEFIKEHYSGNKEYRDSFLNNLTLGDILSLKGYTALEKLRQYYDLYNKINNIKFKITINDFLKSNLLRKFNIIKCLLLGPKSAIKNGSMLFGMTKEQNTKQNNKEIIADILYRNLSHSLQIKLRKSDQYIRQELERISSMSNNDIDLKQQCIMNTNMTDHVKKCIMTKIDDLKNNSSEYQKNMTYIKTLMDYPWIQDDYVDDFTTIGDDLMKCREKLSEISANLDKKVFGQTEFKTVINDIVAKWFTNPNSMGKAIGLCGPPGCGKTLIASGLGKVLNIPCQEIHLGGVEDGSILSGHSYTYSGAQPGLIVTKMVSAGAPRCILFFDELDKVGMKHGINEIFNVLIHATDQNTNANFNDKFFQDVTFPLNKCIFVFSFNDASKIDPILKDRMEIINVSPYTITDKIEIVRNYLLDEILKGVGIKHESVVMNNQTIEYIVNNYTLEAGVRKLKNCLEKIILKLNVDRIHGKGLFKNAASKAQIRITKKHVMKYLGDSSNNYREKIHNDNQVGVINGLYATSVGSGGITPILIYPTKNNNDKFSLELTGKQGDVMKESINFSWTIAKNCVKQEIIDKFYKQVNGLHIHTPDGGTAKDGPSAGCAFTIAFISRLTNLPIKKDIAMTGEINIGGNISAIGGLEYKLIGAKNAGVKLVFVCEENITDLKKIKEKNINAFNVVDSTIKDDKNKITYDNLVKKKGNNDLNVMIVNSVYDIIPYVLIDNNFVNEYKVTDKTCDVSIIMNKF